MVYADKTDIIYNLTKTLSYVFLSRPRRFGKSLLVSTLESYFEGRKELFTGLKIEQLETQWEKHPVLSISFAGGDYHNNPEKLCSYIDQRLARWEEKYGIRVEDRWKDSLNGRLERVIAEAHRQSGHLVVFLVDEYDHPVLLNDMEQEQDKIRDILKGFFGAIKNCAKDIHFSFFTGVTKMPKVSIFSDLNNLKDISMDEKYSTICGITDAEMVEYLSPEIEAMAAKNRLTTDECIQKIRNKYDGYHFASDLTGVYNPFSLINALTDHKFKNYWFESGSSSYLIRRFAQKPLAVPTMTSNNIYATEEALMTYDPLNTKTIPLLYQSGYLTLKEGPDDLGTYKLGFPNEEVSVGFMEGLLPLYTNQMDEDSENGLGYRSIIIKLRQGDLGGVMQTLTSVFASIPYSSSALNALQSEAVFQNAFCILFTLLGYDVRSEVRFATGRADAIVQTQDTVYIFEFKRDGSAQSAIEQIKSQSYATPFLASGKRIRRVGVNFSSQTNTIKEWAEA